MILDKENIRHIIIVTKKLIELKIEDTPAMCKEKITRSKEALYPFLDSGG